MQHFDKDETLPRSVLNVGVAVSGMLMLMCVWTVLRQNSSWRLYDVSDDDDDDDDVLVGVDWAALLTVRWQFSEICSSLCKVTENYNTIQYKSYLVYACYKKNCPLAYYRVQYWQYVQRTHYYYLSSSSSVLVLVGASRKSPCLVITTDILARHKVSPFTSVTEIWHCSCWLIGIINCQWELCKISNVNFVKGDCKTKHYCFILSMGTRIRIDSVMRPRSSSRGRNTSASVTVTVVTVSLKSKLS